MLTSSAGTDWLAVTTAASAAVSTIFVVGGVVVGVRQLVLTRRANTVTMLAQMIVQWDGPSFKDLRRQAARGMLADPPEYEYDWLDLLAWLEILALYVVGERVINLKDAWNAFAEVIISYVLCSATQIAAYRQVQLDVFSEPDGPECEVTGVRRKTTPSDDRSRHTVCRTTPRVPRVGEPAAAGSRRASPCGDLATAPRASLRLARLRLARLGRCGVLGNHHPPKIPVRLTADK